MWTQKKLENQAMPTALSSSGRLIIIQILLTLTSLQLSAQWLTQEIPLSPGWNGVQACVQPAQAECAVLFSNTAVEKVYWWHRTGAGMEFDLDPRDPLPRSADWNYWFATNAAISSFGSLVAGECYLIRVADNAEPFVLRLTGKPVLNAIRWIPGEPNLVGLPVSTNLQISFSEFFSFSTDFSINSATASIFRITGLTDSPERVWTPATELARGGMAYWITAGKNAQDYSGAIQVETAPASRMLDFGDSVSPRSLIIRNRTSASRAVQIEHLASESPPVSSGFPAWLGKTPLVYKPQGDLSGGYQAFPALLVTNVPALGQVELSLAPDSQALAGGVPGSTWQSVIRITSETAADIRLGVSCDGSLSSQLDPAGLWVGSVSVTHVERAPTRIGADNVWKNDGPVSVSEPYAFRLIMHVDALGTPRLLQRALLAYRHDESETDTTVSLTTNGILTILTDEKEATAYAAVHSGARIVRVSSTCFPFMDPLPLSGTFGSSNTLSGLVTIPSNDPVNPFVHRYHPQHDNLRYDNGVATNLEEGVETYTVTRDMSFLFSLLDPSRGVANRQWGVTETGGIFEETVAGLNKTIRIRGTFKLERVSRVSEFGPLNN
jgi:hypothetical protein